MGDSGALPDINVSNGTCYYTEHEETRGNFIACGNVAFGHWPCCQAGDMCLSLGNVNGCWDSDTGNTYLAGCTDPGFNARACPWKPPLFHEQEWVAIQQCHSGPGAGAGGDDGNTVAWGGCKVDANQTTLEKLPHASCDPYCSVTVVQDASVLPAFASLPGSAGGAIKWTSGFDPTATAKGVRPAVTGESSSSTITGSVSPGSSITTPPDATATSPPPAATSSSDDDGGLTVGAKAGIGVGAAGAALLIVAVVLLGLLVRRRRQRRNSRSQLADATTSSHHPHPYDESLEQQQQQQEQVMYYNNVFYNKTTPPPTTVTTVVPGVGSQPYVGYKAELSADEVQQKQTGFKSELAADETTMPRNEIGSSGGHDYVGESRAGSRRGSSGAHMTPGGGGGNGLSPHPSPHPSSAATAHSPFSVYSEVSTLYASSGSGSGGGGTGRWAPPPPTPPQQHQQRHGDHPAEHEWPLPNGHGGSGGMQSFRERQQGRGGSWRSHGYDPS